MAACTFHIGVLAFQFKIGFVVVEFFYFPVVIRMTPGTIRYSFYLKLLVVHFLVTLTTSSR